LTVHEEQAITDELLNKWGSKWHYFMN
jgi:hypothetical protein